MAALTSSKPNRVRLATLGLLLVGLFAGTVHGRFGLPTPQPSSRQDEGSPQRWEPHIRKLEQYARSHSSNSGGVVFVGSSSIRLWRGLAQDMAPVRVLRQGFGGAQTLDVLHYAKRLVLPHSPRAVVYYAGDNDLANKPPPPAGQVRAHFAKFVKTIRQSGQSPEFYFVSIKPSPRRFGYWPQMEKANHLMEELAWRDAGIHYVDIASAMLGADGLPRPELYADDGLHMSPRGYALWTRILKPILQSQVGPNPLFL